MVQPEHEPLTMYGRPSEFPPLSWAWVDAELARAGSYWVTARGGPHRPHPHPRPVWGVWSDDRLHLSIGSPPISRLLAADPAVTVHLGSDVDVVIVDGHVAGPTESTLMCDRYNDKYDWDYTVDEYGPLTTIVPSTVLAWRSAGWAGREGFQQTGRWRLTDQR